MGQRRVVFDHIAIGMARMAEAPAVLVSALGGVPDSGAARRSYRWGCWRFAGGGRLEVIEPRREEGFLARFLAQRGPGIHHVTFKVPSLARACARAEAHGYKVVGYDASQPLWKEAFLHPKQALGIVVQLAESSPGAPPGRWEPPPGAENPPPPVTLLGLSTRARSAERARTQWELVLEGVGETGPAGELIYRWPGSPMRVLVEVDPVRDEGPIAIEFASDRPVPLAATPHPVLGVVFVRRPADPPARER